MPCDVCGSFKHADHPDCNYCGSSRHVEHPVCCVCGSYEHADHPSCGYCGSFDHAEHPRCRECGDYDHEVHPRCSVCDTDAHTAHEEVYLKECETDVALYWTTLRVFTKKLSALLEELEQDVTWTKVKRDWRELGESDEQIQVVERWKLGLHSATNSLAALLKVELNFNPVFETAIRRDQLEQAKWIVFARDLLAISSGLLADFDAISAK